MTSERPVTSASQYLFASVSPHRAGTWDEREQGRVSAPLGWHCHPCLDSTPRLSRHRLLCLSAAQGPSLRQETIAFPPASRTLGKPPGQPAEQISGGLACWDRAPATPRRAVPERLGFAARRPAHRGQAPTLRSARRLLSAAPTALRAGGAVGPGATGREGGQPSSTLPQGWPGQQDGGAIRGSWCAGMVCVAAAVPLPGDDARWPGSGALVRGQEPRAGAVGWTTHRCVHWVLQESPCLASGKAGSWPREERPRQRNVCGDRDGFEQG